MSDRPQVLIVGGGLAGLACAVALVDRGVAVTVLEKEARLGGRASSWTHEATGDRVDIGPHVVLSEYPNFIAFLQRLGTGSQITWQPETVLTVVTQKGPHALRHHALPTPLSLLPDFLTAPGLPLRDFLTSSRATWRALRFEESQLAQWDGVDGLTFLRAQGCSERMIDWFWRFASMAVMNTPLERVSTAALLRMHLMMIGHRRTHFGMPAVGLGDLYTEQARAAIENGGGRVILQALAQDMDLHRWGATHGVVAVPPAELETLLPGLVETSAFEPSPYVSTYLWFDRRVTRAKFWSLLWSPDRMYYDFYDLANIRSGWESRSSVIACNLICSHRAEGLTDAELVEIALREVAEFEPGVQQARLLHSDVHRIPMAIALAKVGSETRRPVTRTARDRIYLAGDWTRTGLPSCMEGAVFSGLRAAEAVLADIGRPETLARPPRPPDGLAGLINPSTGVRPLSPL